MNSLSEFILIDWHFHYAYIIHISTFNSIFIVVFTGWKSPDQYFYNIWIILRLSYIYRMKAFSFHVDFVTEKSFSNCNKLECLPFKTYPIDFYLNPLVHRVWINKQNNNIYVLSLHTHTHIPKLFHSEKCTHSLDYIKVYLST